MGIKHLAKRGLGIYKDFKRVNISEVQKTTRNTDSIKLFGFVKCFNEGKNGNLERCLNHLSAFCNDIVLCDDDSSDNSVKIAKKYTKHIIQMPNNFKEELSHKQKLLELAASLDPDWIVSLDPDEIFDRSGEQGGIRSLCQYGEEHEIDSFSFLYYNLWKGKEAYRVDELWNKNWQTKLWKNNGNLRFDVQEGLHLRQYPLGLVNDRRTDIKIIHHGFSNNKEINRKYSVYASLGQSGWALERIKDEKNLLLKKFSKDWFPLSTMKITVVCLIYKSIGYANFVLSSFNKHTCRKGRDIDFLFVANDPTDELLEHLSEKKIQHLLYRNNIPNENYLKRVYRAWNYGGFNAPGDIIVFVNSDMAFSDKWLDNLVRNLREDRIVTSRLVESGKLRSGKYGIENNFGRTYSKFDDDAFQRFTKKISTHEIKDGGLFMPCAIHKDLFIKSGGFPIGNRTEEDSTITPGDRIFFYEKLLPMGIKHYTVFDSIVYHIQEGEIDS